MNPIGLAIAIVVIAVTAAVMVAVTGAFNNLSMP